MCYDWDISRFDGLPSVYLPSWAPDLVSTGLDGFNNRMIGHLIKKDEYPEIKREATRRPNVPRKKARNAIFGNLNLYLTFHDKFGVFQETGAMIGISVWIVYECL